MKEQGTVLKKILLIDDEKGFTDLLKLNLEADGNYQVLVENNPVRAVQAASLYKPDIILLDILMPEKEGPDVAYDLREDKFLRDIPIVFLTAAITHDEVDSQEGVIGGHPFLAKPSSIEEIITAIERHTAFS